MKVNIGEVWTHYKAGGEYEIVEMGKLQVKNELDMAECVIYKNRVDQAVWVRPMVDFLEEVAPGVMRFKKLE